MRSTAAAFPSYEKAGKNTQRAVIGNERVPQEFVTLEQKAKSFPETL